MEVRSLSRRQAKVVLSLEADGQELLSLSELRARAGVSAGFARKIAHDLVHKGWLQRTSRGSYILNPARHGPDAIPDSDPFRVGRRLATPYYFGFATAAELHGLLPQLGRTYYLATLGPARRTVRPGVEYCMVHLPRSELFGTETIVRRGMGLVVSDVERTVLDAFRRPEFSGGMPGAARVLERALPRLDGERLGRYLARIRNESLGRRIGYVAELFRRTSAVRSRWVEELLPPNDAPYVPLGPAREYGRRGIHHARWRVVQNVPEARLLGETRIR